MNTVDVTELREFSGDEYRKTNLFETERMFSDVYCFEPGQEQAAHTHGDADKIYHVLEGEGTFVVGDDERVLGEGETVVAPAGKRHGVRNGSGDRLRTLVFMAWDHAPDGETTGNE